MHSLSLSSYRYYGDITPQAKLHQFLLSAIDVGLFCIGKEYCNVASILNMLAMIFNGNENFYNCYYSHKDIIVMIFPHSFSYLSPNPLFLSRNVSKKLTQPH